MIVTETLVKRTTTGRQWIASASQTVVFQATIFWAISRVILWLFTIMAVLFTHDKTPQVPLAPDTILHAWSQWDAGWYFAIADAGYYSKDATVYFPLYPGLIHLGTQIFGIASQFWVAIVISHLSTLAAFIGIGLLAEHEAGERGAALPAIKAIAAYPLALFLSAPYTEALFLALAVWTLYATRRGWWYLAAGCALFAALTRPTGVILWLPMVWEYGRQQGWWQKVATGWQDRQQGWADLRAWLAQVGPTRAALRGASQGLAMLGAVPLALGGYSLFCWIKFHDAFAYLSAEKDWFHQTMFPWQTLGVIQYYYRTIPDWSYNQARFLVDFVPLAFFLLIVVVAWRRWPVAYTLYLVGLVWLCIAAPTVNGGFPFPLMSVSRYLLVAVPIFLRLGQWSRKYLWVEQTVIMGGFMLQALFTAYYLSGGWIV